MMAVVMALMLVGSVAAVSVSDLVDPVFKSQAIKLEGMGSGVVGNLSVCSFYSHSAKRQMIYPCFVDWPFSVSTSYAPSVPVLTDLESASFVGVNVSGFTLSTDRSSKEYLIQFAVGTVAKEALVSDVFGLYLQPVGSQTVDLTAYYSSKPPAYRDYLNGAAAGSKPFAYVKGDGTTNVKLLDGARFTLAGVESDMAVPADYPFGSYTVMGYLKTVSGKSEKVSFTLKVE